MQNPTNARIALIPIALLITFIGCGPRQPTAQERAALQAGYQSYGSKNYEQAMAQADAYLTKHPQGPGSAEALYLRGRSFEARTAENQNEARQNLQSARTAYIQALERKPDPRLTAHIRTSLGNVAYFQDDYATAIQQWSAVNPRDLKNPDVTSWILYRTGIAQQRIGQFEAADKTFASVQQQFPGTEPARRAKEHQGVRAFYVQLGAYTNATSASSAASDVRRQGVNPVTIKDPQGRQLLRVGPVPSYAQAVSLKSRFTSKYPDAIVVP